MKSEHEARVERKRHKVQALNGRLSTWYRSMESRRAGLAQVAPSEVAKFNTEAAAYTAFRAVAKKEADELGKLQAKRYDSYNAISDQETATIRNGWKNRVVARSLALKWKGPISGLAKNSPDKLRPASRGEQRLFFFLTIFPLREDD